MKNSIILINNQKKKPTLKFFKSLCLFLFASQVISILYAWTPVKRLTWTTAASKRPHLASYLNSNLYLLWSDNSEIYFKKSTDNGNNWYGLKRLTWTPTGTSNEPRLAIDSLGGIHCIWEDNVVSTNEIYYKKSTDQGTSWTSIKRLTWSSTNSLLADITVGFSAIHVVWIQESYSLFSLVLHKKSTNGGISWSKPTRLTWGVGYRSGPRIVLDGTNTLHAVWSDSNSGAGEIFYKKSTDAGGTWSSLKRLTWNSGHSGSPSIWIDSSNNIYIAWEDNSPGNYEIYFKKSTDGGITWSPIKRLTWLSGDSLSPEIAAFKKTASIDVHIVFYDDISGNNEIYYKQSLDAGTTWGSLQRLCWNYNESVDPSITLNNSGNNVHVVWADSSQPSTNDFEIYYKRK